MGLRDIGIRFIHKFGIGTTTTTAMSRSKEIFTFCLALTWTIHFAWCSDITDFSKCRGVDVDLAEDHAMHMNDCLKAAGATEILNIAPANMPCFGKCVFSKKGIIDEHGKPHKDKLMGLVTDKLPKEVHEDLDKKLSVCLDPTTTEIIDPEDESCATYLPMMMCVHIAFLEECHG